MVNVFNVLLGLFLINLANVLFLMLFVGNLIVRLKCVRNVILVLLWIRLGKYVLMLLLQQLILIVELSKMDNVLNAHSDSSKMLMENVNQLILLADCIIHKQANVMHVMMVTNQQTKNAKKMKQQFLIQTAHNGRMENVQNVHMVHISQMEYVNQLILYA